MGLTRDAALLTTAAEVAARTQVQALANIEAASEVTVAGALLEAHRWVYDRLRNRFSAATLAEVSNTTALERAVAYALLEDLAAAQMVSQPPAPSESWGRKAERLVDAFRPEFVSADAPRAVNEPVPVVRNPRTTPLFGC